jgi:hypothetical protein
MNYSVLIVQNVFSIESFASLREALQTMYKRLPIQNGAFWSGNQKITSCPSFLQLFMVRQHQAKGAFIVYLKTSEAGSG